MSIVVDRKKIQELIDKYGVSVPRYTSYPTAPEWKDEYSQDKFEQAIARSNKTRKDYSLYLHIPFCESQCYYCGCNVVIAPKEGQKGPGIEQKYVDQLKEELSYYGECIDKNRKVAQMAWGGGTPTYLTPDQILDLSNHIRENFSLYPKKDSSLKTLVEDAKELVSKKSLKPEHEYAIEIDPRVTTRDHLEALWEAGFNRLSMGVQDFNPVTQEAINRIQSYEMTSKLIEDARDIGFTSINLDLVYGLPHQNLETFSDTIERIKEISPERIALFNYAHIPAMFPFQAKYIDENAMPDQEEKMKIFDKAVEEFTNHGFDFIGLDHFSKSDDGMAIAQKERKLYRNFQGYTTHAGCDLFGFGITAISDVQGVYKQNYKKLNKYYDSFLGGDKFKSCTNDDIERREIIKQIMCNNYVELDALRYADEIKALGPYIEDELVEWGYIKLFEGHEDMKWADQNVERANQLIENRYITLEVTELGRFFVRNIASAFDTYIKQAEGHKTFSKSL